MGQEAFDTGSYEDYISLGLLADHNTEAYRYAEEIQAKLNGGRKVTNIEMGQLAAAVYADALGVGEKRTAEEQEAPEDDLGDGGLAGEDTYEQNAVINRIRDKAWRNTVDKASENGIIDLLFQKQSTLTLTSTTLR